MSIKPLPRVRPTLRRRLGSRRALATLVLVVLLPFLGGAAWAASDPGERGPFSVARETVDIPVRDGAATRTTEVYYPGDGAGGVDPAAGQLPVVVYGHGFSRNRSRYVSTGEHLASRGYVVLISDYRCGIFSGCDRPTNAREMSDTLSWILERDEDPTSRFFARIAREALGAAGHSAGGLRAILAAELDPRVVALAPLDPVDSEGRGVDALPAFDIPVTVIYSEPSSCNAEGSAEDLFASTTPPAKGSKLVGANHCDPETDLDFLGCALSCGAWDAERHERYLRAMTAWFELFLRCDPAYETWVFGPQAQAQLDQGIATYEARMTPARAELVETREGEGAIEVERAPPARCRTAQSWDLERAESAAGPFEVIEAEIPIELLIARDEGAVPGAEYFYRARDRFSDFRETFIGEPSDALPASLSGSPGEASPPGAPLTLRLGAGGALVVNYEPAACASDHVARWQLLAAVATAPPVWEREQCGLGTSGEATLDVGGLAPGHVLQLVVVGQDGEFEGSYGRSSSGTERAPWSGLGGCARSQRLEGACP